MNDDHFMLEHSVIRIIGKDGKTTCGTGFLVAENIAVTCAHVIGVAGAKPGSLIQIRFDGLSSIHWASVAEEPHYSPPELDDIAFVLLRDLPEGVTQLPLASAERCERHPYKCYGYPTNSDPADSHKAIGTVNGVVSAKDPGVRPVLVMVAEDWYHGMSGAPIYDEALRAVIGMVTKGRSLSKTQLGYATTADTIHFHNPQILFNERPIPGLPPQGTLPNPAPLPPGSRMTHPRNDLFTGREEDLLALAADLLYSTSSKSVALTPPVAAAGMGGIGKTQLATEFCYRYGQFCEGVHWINAANAEAIGDEITTCGSAMGVTHGLEKQQEQVDATLLEWAKSKQRIVVLDNLEDPGVLREWLPQLGNVKVLVTTRFMRWPRAMPLKLHRLDYFKRNESLELLRSLAPRLVHEPDGLLEELAALLSDLPLAIELAGGYLEARKNLSPIEYMAELRDSGILNNYSMNDDCKNETTHHIQSLDATFTLSWKALDAPGGTRRAKEMRLARLAFRCAGYCAPAVTIPLVVLRDAVRELTKVDCEDRDFNAIFDLGISQICSLGLLDPAEGGVSIHPLLAEYARCKDDSQQDIECVLPTLAKGLSERGAIANNTGLPSDFQPFRPHIESVALHTKDRFATCTALLLTNLGFHSKAVAEFVKAKEYYEQALAIDEQEYGMQHQEVAKDANNLGSALKALGKLNEAKECFERALEIDEYVYGKEHQIVAIRANNLGSVLKAMGELEGAKALYRRALAIDEKVFGLEHPSVAIRVNNLGTVLASQGNFEDARALYERAMAIDEKANGKNHPKVAIRANNLGKLLHAQGDLQGAKAYIERALSIDEQVYGMHHPKVAKRVYNLGQVLQELGDPEGAKVLFERALSIDEHVNKRNAQ